jgi:RND family efflux transporter MFP subunit
MSQAAAANQTTLEVAFRLLEAPDSAGRAALLCASVVNLLPDAAAVLYRFDAQDDAATWTAIGLAGDVSVEQRALNGADTLFAPIEDFESERILYPGSQVRREQYAHLNVTRSIGGFAYLPLVHQEKQQLIGVLEILSFSTPITAAVLDELAPLEYLAAPALLAGEDFERQRQDLFDSIHRLTQLYDLEKSLNSTLDLDRVIALIPRKCVSMLGCRAIHLWLFDGDTLRLSSTAGTDPTVQVGQLQAAGEGYVADMAEEGDPLLIDDPEDERLRSRNADAPETPVFTAMLVPLMQDEAEVGVLEAVNKLDGSAFNDDDQFFLSSVAETVSSALKNASLMFAERKLEILEALVRVSSEITSTLRLDRLLQIIVNSPQNVLPFERCSIALDNRGKLQLRAISGMAHIPLGDAQVEPLHELVRWLAAQPEALHLRQTNDAPDPELPDAVARHFEKTGLRGLYTLPLSDDQGRVGQLIYESSDPDFLDLSSTEMIKILAGQATVAIRNALLYREVPLIRLLEPLVQRKQALLRTSRSRRLTYAAIAAAVALFFIFCPLPMRLTGPATVAPQHLVTIAAPVDGSVAAVFAHEGQRVTPGELLASINDMQWRIDLASTEARYHAAVLTMQSDLERNSPQAGADRAQVEYLRAEADRARSRLQSAQLRSPIAGIVVTPNLQNAAGEHLDAGATFAQVLDLSSAVVDIAIPQRDVALLQPDESAAIKLDSYPQRSWHGVVRIVSPESEPADGDRTFAARVPLPNTDATLRSGMTGRAKIFIGYRPAGYVLLRPAALWIWQTLWNWIGW